MYKVKTHSGAKKRFKKLKSGLVKAFHPYKRHLLTKKSSKRKRDLGKTMYLSPHNAHHVSPLLPY